MLLTLGRVSDIFLTKNGMSGHFLETRKMLSFRTVIRQSYYGITVKLTRLQALRTDGSSIPCLDSPTEDLSQNFRGFLEYCSQGTNCIADTTLVPPETKFSKTTRIQEVFWVSGVMYMVKCVEVFRVLLMRTPVSQRGAIGQGVGHPQPE